MSSTKEVTAKEAFPDEEGKLLYTIVIEVYSNTQNTKIKFDNEKGISAPVTYHHIMGVLEEAKYGIWKAKLKNDVKFESGQTHG